MREDPSEDTQPPRGSAVPATGAKPRPDKGGDPGSSRSRRREVDTSL